MQSAALMLVMLLALHGLAAESTAPCETDITIFTTSIATVYNYGNGSYTRSTDVFKTSDASTTIPVTPVSTSAHTNLEFTISAVNNVNSTSYKEGIATSGVKATTAINVASLPAPQTSRYAYLPPTNMSKTCTTEHESSATSQKSMTTSTYTFHASGSPATTVASSKIVDIAVLPNQSSVNSTTTQTKEITITQPATITCTIGSICLDSNASLGGTDYGASSFEVTSSTTTRTTIVRTSAANSYFSASVTPLKSRPLTTVVEPSVNTTNAVAQSNTSAVTVKDRPLNNTWVTNLPAVSTASNSTVLYTSPSLSSNSLVAPLSTSVVVTTMSSTKSTQTEDNSPTLTSTVVVTPIIVPVTSTVTASGPALDTNAAGKLQPPRVFGLLAAIADNLKHVSAKSTTTKLDSTTAYPQAGLRSEVILTTTFTPTKYITAPPPECTEQSCMSILGFDSAAARLLPGSPFMVSLLGNFFTGLKARAETKTLLTTATTITVTIYRHSDNEIVTGTEDVSSTVDLSSTGGVSSAGSISITSNASGASTDTMSAASCAPYCGLPGGINAPSTTDSSILLSRPGFEPTSLMTHRPSGNAAGKEEKLVLVPVLFMLPFFLMVLVI